MRVEMECLAIQCEITALEKLRAALFNKPTINYVRKAAVKEMFTDRMRQDPDFDFEDFWNEQRNLGRVKRMVVEK